MKTVHFYFGEVKGSNDKYYSCYIEALDEFKAENKLLAYCEENLMTTIGEVESVSISEVDSNEYYLRKQSNRWPFI